MKTWAYIIVLALSLGTIRAEQIKAVIFDCDGTLIDNGRADFLDWHYALQCQGYELNEEEFWQFMSQNNFLGHPGKGEEITDYCCKLVGRDCKSELRKALAENHHPGHAFPPIADTVAFLQQLANEKEQLGIKIGLASGGSREHIFNVLRHLKIEHLFDLVVSGWDDLESYADAEGTNKPKPYVYMHAAKLLGLAPEECVAIEDSRAGILAATSAGCITIAVPNAYTRYQDLSPAHLKIDSFANLSPEAFFQNISASRAQRKQP